MKEHAHKHIGSNKFVFPKIVYVCFITLVGVGTCLTWWTTFVSCNMCRLVPQENVWGHEHCVM